MNFAVSLARNSARGDDIASDHIQKYQCELAHTQVAVTLSQLTKDTLPASSFVPPSTIEESFLAFTDVAQNVGAADRCHDDGLLQSDDIFIGFAESSATQLFS